MILDTISIVLASVGAASGVGSLVYRKRHDLVAPKSQDDSIPWNWKDSGYSDECGIKCKKCNHIKGNKTPPLYCECEEYPDGHFHFECKTCKYKAIMRTADAE